MNEASLVVEPVAVGPLLNAKRFVMVGDYYQLNPIVKSGEAEKRGMGISLFRKLCEQHPYKVVILRKQYRMNDHIASLSNTIAYRGLIKHATPEVANQVLNLKASLILATPLTIPWLKEIKLPERKVLFINIDNLLNKTLQKQLNSMRNKNYFEAAIVHALLESFLCPPNQNPIPNELGDSCRPRNMAIVTPFVEQQILLQRKFQKFKVPVHLIDNIQNLQKDILIISCIKHNKKCINLQSIRKIYTAFTHAKKKLILVGSMANLKEVDPLDLFIGYIRKKNWYIDINNAL